VIPRRTLEIATAALTGAFGIAIMVSSLRSGVGWTPRGMDSGTFPFIAGVLIIAASLYNAARASRFAGPIVLERPGILKLAGMLLPAVLFVAAIPFAGLHVAAAAYVFGMVAFHDKGGIRKAAAIAVVTPLSLYGIFDWGFQVPLPRGTLGAALGF
jgi:hypothetical protein